MTTLADRFAVALKEAGIKQVDLAKAMGVTPPSLSQVLSGRSKSVTCEHLFKAAEFLRVSPRWLAVGDGPKEPDIHAVDCPRMHRCYHLAHQAISTCNEEVSAAARNRLVQYLYEEAEPAELDIQRVRKLLALLLL